MELGASSDRLALRSPTYASDCLANHGGASVRSSSHMSPVAALAALPVSGDGEEAALSISSLDVEGTLIIWLVLEAVELDALDLGQAVGGKERLLLSGTSSMTDGHGGASGTSVLPTRCVQMRFLPTDASRLLVATDLPAVLSRSRYSALRPSPEAYLPDIDLNVVTQDASGVSSMAFHPTSPSHFLVGRHNGTVALHHVDDSRPLLTHVGFTKVPIVQVEWSPSKPGLYWALDSDDTMHLFDLVAGNGAPIVSSTIATKNNPNSPTRRVGASPHH